jgi:hypothetical protein
VHETHTHIASTTDGGDNDHLPRIVLLHIVLLLFYRVERHVGHLPIGLHVPSTRKGRSRVIATSGAQHGVGCICQSGHHNLEYASVSRLDLHRSPKSSSSSSSCKSSSLVLTTSLCRIGDGLDSQLKSSTSISHRQRYRSTPPGKRLQTQ